MPLPFLLATWGLWASFRRGGAAALRIPLLGALAIPGGIMFYGYIAYRYTSEFVPLLVVGSAVGLADIGRRLAARPAPWRWRRAALGGMAALAAFGLVANSAAALTTLRISFPGPRLRDYVIYQEKLSSAMGDPIDSWVDVSDELPRVGDADHLHIVGECESLYIGTGEPLEPWVVVEAREARLRIELLEPPTPSTRLELLSFEGHRRTEVVVERQAGNRFRFGVDDGEVEVYGRWVRFEPGDEVEVVVRTDPTGGRYVVEVPGTVPLDVPMEQIDDDWFALPNVLDPTPPDPAAAEADGFRVEPLPTPPLEWCERLLARQP
jgi:hypothetical protein